MLTSAPTDVFAVIRRTLFAPDKTHQPQCVVKWERKRDGAEWSSGSLWHFKPKEFTRAEAEQTIEDLKFMCHSGWKIAPIHTDELGRRFVSQKYWS